MAPRDRTQMRPFVPGAIAKDDDFYGRTEELDTVAQAVGWTWLCGPRRMGKSSLLLALARRLRAAGHLAMYFDLGVFAGEEGVNGAAILPRVSVGSDRERNAPTDHRRNRGPGNR